MHFKLKKTCFSPKNNKKKVTKNKNQSKKVIKKMTIAKEDHISFNGIK